MSTATIRLRPLTAMLAIVIALYSLGVTSMALADPPASAVPSNDCAASVSPYAFSRAELVDCGIPTYPADVTPLLDGGWLYSYYEPTGGLFAETAMPPADFDPRSASAAQLAEYGYPPRPEDPVDQSAWERMVEVPRVTPEPFIASGASFSATFYNSHWSGHITTSGGFTYAEADYTEPSFNNNVCGPSAEVTWAGIGGGPGSPEGSALFQDGTAHSNGLNIGLGNHQPWWEILVRGQKNNPAQPFPQGGATGFGDSVTAVTDTQSLPGYVSFNVFDYTSGRSWQATVPRNGRTPSPATAEMIAERPEVKGGFPALSDFASLFFNSDEAAQNGIAQWLSLFPRDAIFMTSDGSSGGKILTDPGVVFEQGGFTELWQHCS